MLPTTIFEHLLCCRGCNSAILVGDAPALISPAVPRRPTGLVIRHGTSPGAGHGSRGCASSLEQFPFEGGGDTPRQRGPGGPGAARRSRQVLYMEDCGDPASRQGFARRWGLGWLTLEEHLEAIAGHFGSGPRWCPCGCHRRCDDAAADDGSDGCSVDTMGAQFISPRPGYHSQLEIPVREPAGACAVEGGGRKTVRWADQPSADQSSPSPAEGRRRARSEGITHKASYILCWREQCRRASS